MQKKRRKKRHTYYYIAASFHWEIFESKTWTDTRIICLVSSQKGTNEYFDKEIHIFSFNFIVFTLHTRNNLHSIHKIAQKFMVENVLDIFNIYLYIYNNTRKFFLTERNVHECLKTLWNCLVNNKVGATYGFTCSWYISHWFEI